MSERRFRRWRRRYEEEGGAGLIDRRLGQASGKRVPSDRAEEVERLYRERDLGFTVKPFHEHLVRDHGFGWGYTGLKLHLQWSGVVPRAPRKGARRRKRERRPLPGIYGIRTARATLRRERAGRPRQQVGQDNWLLRPDAETADPRKPDAAQSSSAHPVACEKNRSALVRRLVSAGDDPARLRIRHLLNGMSDDRLLSLGLTAQALVLLRGAASAPD